MTFEVIRMLMEITVFLGICRNRLQYIASKFSPELTPSIFRVEMETERGK
jgi:hypothetical protein